MIESDPQRRHYRGQENESVTVTVEAQNTNHLVTYTLEGVSQQLPQGQPINFSLKRKPGNGPTLLKLNFDFSVPAGGSYRVVVKDVQGYPNNESWRIWEQTGSLVVIKDYKFFVQ